MAMSWTEQEFKRFIKRGRRAAKGSKQAAVTLATQEKAWQAQVEYLLALFSWSYYHTRDSRRSAEGFPDLVACRPPRLIFAELKRDGKEPTGPQWSWLDAFAKCGAECYVWHPSDIDEIRRLLR